MVQTAEELHGRVLKKMLCPCATQVPWRVNMFVDDLVLKEVMWSSLHLMPYARRLYYHPEYHFNKEHNPNAGGKWLAPWLKGGKTPLGEVEKTYGKIYGMMLNGGGE